MTKHLMIGFSIAASCLAGFAAHASAQVTTRAEVHRASFAVESQGLRFVTDTSYPDVDPMFQQQADPMKNDPDSGGMGGQAAGSSNAGKRDVAPSTRDPSACVGPVSFCTPYFGS